MPISWRLDVYFSSSAATKVERSGISGTMDDQQSDINYKQKYKVLKQKLKFLVYENESFQEEMRKSQRRLLRISRDKSFLLDRLLQYEKVGDSSSESDDTASSSSEPEKGTKVAKRKKTLSISHSLAPPLGTTDPMAALAALGYPGLSKPGGKLSSGKTGEPHKKKPKSSSKSATQPGQSTTKSPVQRAKPHKMSTEDIHRHLQAKKLIVDTETIPTSVPQEMFSTTPDEIAAEPSPAPQPEDNDQLIIDIPE